MDSVYELLDRHLNVPKSWFRLGRRWVPQQYQAYLETKACGYQVVGGHDLAGVWSGYGNPDSDKIAFTFDDGPTPGVTDIILDAFKKRKWAATFFQIGENVKSHSSLTRRVLHEGHEIGNHTMHHVRCGLMQSESSLRKEITEAQDVLYDVIGEYPKWFRPPFGSLRLDQGDVIAALQLGLAFWNGNPRDWQHPGVEQIVKRTTSYICAGSIVVMHDVNQQTAQAIEPILQLVEKAGLKAVSFSEVLTK